MLKAGVLVLAIAAAAASAQAAPLSDDFQVICAKTAADPKAALAAADAAGWMPIPQAMIGQLASGMKALGQLDGRLRSDASGLRFMVVAEGKALPGSALPLGIDRAVVCMTASAPPDASVDAQVTAWAGVPASSVISNDKMRGYIFSLDGEEHRAVDPKGPDLAKLAEQRLVRIVFVQSDSKITMVGLAVPLKEPH